MHSLQKYSIGYGCKNNWNHQKHYLGHIQTSCDFILNCCNLSKYNCCSHATTLLGVLTALFEAAVAPPVAPSVDITFIICPPNFLTALLPVVYIIICIIKDGVFKSVKNSPIAMATERIELLVFS